MTPRHRAPEPDQPEPERPSRPGRRRRGLSSMRLIWVYPDLLSTYGDRGNLLVLERRARLRGIETEALAVNADQPVPRTGDIYLMGGGEDLPQVLAARRLRADGGLAAAASGGAVLLAVCAGYQVLGTEFGGAEGEPVPGLGILDIRSGRGERRGVGEIVADVDPQLGVPRLTGFENHQGVTTLGPGARPLARVTTGVGNGDGTEGAYAGRVVGTYLHGPVLVRNPGLADLLLSWVAGPLAALSGADEDWARRLRDECLCAVGHDLGQERRSPRDADSLDDVLGGDVPPRRALGADRNGPFREHACQQLGERRRVRKRHVVGAVGQGEPGGFAGQPQRHLKSAGNAGRGDGEGLVAAFLVVLARGDLDDE